ncbi:hypothetical protein ABK040_012544 [Willaertia magna]
MSTSLLFTSEQELTYRLGTKYRDIYQNEQKLNNALEKRKEFLESYNRTERKYETAKLQFSNVNDCLETINKYKQKTKKEYEQYFESFLQALNKSEGTVSFMNCWFLEHVSNPFPSSTEKKFLSLKTGLSDKQITNWFINTRGRSWKPFRGAVEATTEVLFVDGCVDLEE